MSDNYYLMMKSLKKVIPVIFATVVCCLLCWHLQSAQRYLYFYREQQQLFIFDADYLSDMVKNVGGLSLLITQWLVQFFVCSLWGPFITALLAVGSSLFLWMVVRRIHPAAYLLPLCFVPSIFQVLSLVDPNYWYQGFVAYFLSNLFLYIYVWSDRWRWPYRLSTGCILAVLLFFVAGSVAVLFAVNIVLFDFFCRKEKAYISISSLLAVVLLASYSVVGAWVGDWRFAFGIDMYYEPMLKPAFFYTFGWLTCPLVLLCFFLMRRVGIKHLYTEVILAVAMAVAGASFYLYAASARNKADEYTLMQLHHYAAGEQWDELIDACRTAGLNNYLSLNYLNLALSHKGMLLSHLFEYPQSGPLSLCVLNNKTQDIDQLLSRIYFAMGDVAAAQYMAFEANVGVHKSYNPGMLKLLVQTNIIMGAYPVAEKYISLLEQSWYYHDWAMSQRRFLYHDKEVARDALLGVKRRDLPSKEDFVLRQGPISDLDNILQTNPWDVAAREYAIAYILLAKDVNSIKYFIEKYALTPAFKPLPAILQEAVLTVYEADPANCRKYGVDDTTLARYNDYKQKFIYCRNQGADPASALNSEYGNTYWYYLMFKQI